MNIIETVKNIIMEYPNVNQVCNDIHVDFTEEKSDNYGLSSTGDMLVSEDIIGNQLRQHNFALYAVWMAQADYDRMINSGVLLDLHYWLEHRTYTETVSVEICGENYTGKIERMTCSNGMLYEIEENFNGKVVYQIQLAAQYKIESEE